MKCSKCGNKTTWDESFGKEHRLVCPKCFDKLLKKNNNDIKFKEIYYEN